MPGLPEGALKDILVRGSYVTSEDVAAAERYVGQKRGTFVDYFLSHGLLTKDLVGQAVAEAYGLPYADLNTNRPSREQVLRIPEEAAKRLRVVVYAETPTVVTVATDNVSDKTLVAQLAPAFSGRKVSLAYSLSDDIDAAFSYYRRPLATRFASIVERTGRVAPEIIEEILADAITLRASDVHFEPQGQELLVRFRIDGVLHEVGRFDVRYYEAILNRIKVQAHMRIDEHFAAQDGAMRHQTDSVVVDLRVSVAPTLDGEKIAIRVLASYTKGFTLNELGLEPDDQALLEAAASKPFGMILMTGPTGSGKTTTLYAVMRILNEPDVNITTIEDPVEYRVTGVNQIQVNAQTSLTFARGLRSIVRQDPDIILVGEIRDEETAEIAVNASLTGHLLLSSFHANDAASAVPRLLDMGVEPFLLSSVVELIAAQRLVRKVCEQCRFSVSVKHDEIRAKHGLTVARFFPEGTLTLYRGKGCPACSNTGYLGRTAIFELIPASKELRSLMLKNPSADEVWALARANGARSLFEDGVKKVLNGTTTVEELLRVAIPPVEAEPERPSRTKARVRA